MPDLGIIGAGNIGTAISRGIIRSGRMKPEQIMMYDIHEEALRQLAQEGMQTASSEGEVVEQCRMVLLSVKPQVMQEVLAAIRPHCRPENIFISIAAGISEHYLKAALGYDAKIVLVMPNTPILIGYGSAAIAQVAPTTREEFHEVEALFAANGIATEVRPDQMCEVIALNSTSPAYVYRFAQIFVERAVELGFEYDAANRMFCHTMIGAAHMMLETGKSHQELIDAVSSKGGTTVAGLKAMDEQHLKEALVAGYDACTKRAYELGK